MAEERVDRRLAAILAADIAGYSRLMGSDEEGTLRQLKGHRKELVDPKITEHRGRIVKTTGDGMLVEFVSVVDAVRCAVDIQRAMIERTARLPLEKRIQFRVGINVGDIIIDGDDIFGDGVNVAARLETLADPGGIMVSRVVRDQVRINSVSNSTIWVSRRSRTLLDLSAFTEFIWPTECQDQPLLPLAKSSAQPPNGPLSLYCHS